jgi:hypothetical protein
LSAAMTYFLKWLSHGRASYDASTIQEAHERREKGRRTHDQRF